MQSAALVDKGLRLQQREGQASSQKDRQTPHILNFEEGGKDWSL